ncbi:zinc finger protein 852 isoform X1 [Drosophila kikkawai]|uniref:Zinc finger protein 852 isoform X1 n=1 Tax=Drosophila kikkawai TaxID=30033 RepID=A0A6P4HXB6_DROKI|nr:transcription factor Ouib [Drosophila kikkawai]
MELKLDMLNVCRTCLQDGDAQMVSIYERADDKERGGTLLCEKLESFSGIQITRTDHLPTRICLKCKAFLILAHKFRQICQRSHDFLSEYVVKDVEEPAVVVSESSPPPVATEQLEQLEVEVLDEAVWADDEQVEDVAAPLEKERPVVLAVETVPAPAIISSVKLHVCEICGNGYPRKSTLDTHMRRHTNERPFECEICHKSFHVNYQLMRHIRQHTGAKPYKCQYCQRCFADRTSLVKHERTHRNERPYGCQTCGKTFTYSSVLKEHYKTHTGEKPHTCKLCGKTFARTHNLVAHMQTQQHLNDPRTAGYLNTIKSSTTVTVVQK